MIDDDRKFTDCMCYLLRARGYEALVENQAEKAAATAKRYYPNIILRDLNMPVPGTDIAVQLKGDAVFSKVPVIFVAGLLSPLEENADHTRAGSLIRFS